MDLERSEDLAENKGYDSERNNRELYNEYGIKPIIDIRHVWKDGGETRALYPERVDYIVAYESESVFCVRQSSRDARQMEMIPMAIYGFEQDHKTLKYGCPAAAYGFECGDREGFCSSTYGAKGLAPKR